MKSISVPIALLEDMLSPCADFATHERLRALLDKPAAQHQGEPVAIDERAAYEEWQWRKDWPIEALAGTTRSECFKRRFLNPEKYQTIRFNDGLAVWLARAAIPVQPAPVAVAIPGRMKTEPFTTIDRGSKNYKSGYNAAIAEVAKLNGIKP